MKYSTNVLSISIKGTIHFYLTLVLILISEYAIGQQYSFQSPNVNYPKENSILEIEKHTFSCPKFSTNICGNTRIIVLDSFSTDGIKGYWTPQKIDTDTIIDQKFSSRWRALDQVLSCSTDTIITFNLDNPKEPKFDILTALCKSYGIYLLPKVSLNSISGSWNINRVNTDTLSLGPINLEFTSNEYCVDPFKTSIEIATTVSPKFEIKSKICISDPAFDLPLISIDGVPGVWTERNIIPSIIGSGFISIFTPNAPYRNCYSPYSVVFDVYNKLKPEFTLPDNVCQNYTNLDFINVSDNNIMGNWGIPNIDFSSINKPVLKNTFIPNNISCHEILIIEIPVISFSQLSLQVAQPSDCGLNDGIITILNARSSDEFKLNGSGAWQSSATFKNLPAGKYTIIIRSKENKSCLDSLKAEIIEPPSPTINMVMATDLTDCKTNNGSVICSASGNNLEYSLNDVSWQSSATFQNLGPGNYNLFVRSNQKNNCKSQTTFALKKAQQPIINGINSTDLTSCTSNDGNISIDAIGQNTIYSIDNGLTFQQSSQFPNLTYGNYKIIVSSTSLTNCITDTVVFIKGPDLPIITNIDTTNQTDCGINNGTIKIMAEGVFNEYSIDNGISWSDNNLFTSLAPAAYKIVVRNRNVLDCSVKDTVIIDSLEYPTIQNVDIVQPNSCISDDGKIEVLTSAANTQFSIDMGLTWKPSGSFLNLKDGNYKILTRLVNTANCIDSASFEIIDPLCPCLKPNVKAEVSQVHCKDSLTGSISVKEITGLYTNENFNFRWCDGSTNMNYGNLGEGWYCYSIDHDRNCTFKDSIFVGTKDPIEFDLTGSNETCKNLGEIEVLNIKGGSGRYRYSLDGTNYQSSALFNKLESQTYTVSVVDSLGCFTKKDISIDRITDLKLELPSVPPIPSGGFAILNPILEPLEIDSFIWNPVDYIDNLNQLNAKVSPPRNQLYTLTVFYGTCSESKSVVIEVLPSEEIFFPNILFLNSQNENNLFHLSTDPRNETRILNVNIFDRWGNLVFYKLNPEINNKYDVWDGTFNNQKVETGAYIFFAELTVNGDPRKVQGIINVIK